MNFKDFQLQEQILKALEAQKITTPTEIQEKAISHALEGKDVLGIAQTGTGKTAAYMIPTISRIISNKCKVCLILAPTRELAQQIAKAAHAFKLKLKTAVIIGGEKYGGQIRDLKANPDIIIATPGRLNDHLSKMPKLLKNVSTLVLDETDRMLDMGFSVQINEILKFAPKEMQTLMFSATFPKHIVKFAGKYLNNPVEIKLNNGLKLNDKIDIKQVRVDDRSKVKKLIHQVKELEGSTIIFVKTKSSADVIAEKLTDAVAFHSNLSQFKRTKVIKSFRANKYKIMVATDIAGRGIDIPEISNVINFDLPSCAEDYVHRVGRTGRAGRTGSAFNFITPKDNFKWKKIFNAIAANSR